ncbi:ankyrin repeat domain-containing protein 13c [Limosa lapponica baueri]|uniref:Ankyrin repeat domain-containing protein 13c n=1 Tax=Limosa lapponica baueri TaxID=1758121 RepID=A0A2I0T9U0_LIMLA|nr:ankyrin repeat domain-containing protein 13c [Limosa lapponica baueri]
MNYITTSLMFAVTNDDCSVTECAHLLLAHNAPVKVKNAQGWSPLAEAISYGDRQMSKNLCFPINQKERVGNFLADFYLVNGLVLESRKRREHLSEEDILRNKAIMESLSKDIPVFPTITATVTFQEFRYDEFDDSIFTIPDDYKEDPSRFPDL